MKLLFLVLAIALSSLRPLGAEETDLLPISAKSNAPAGIVAGTVKAMRGHSFGYVPPKVGESFELDISSLNQINERLTFGKEAGEKSYIPLPGPFAIKDVALAKGAEQHTWNSFRAVSKNDRDRHQVTLDVSRHPGMGDPNYVIVWILIEHDNRISGLCEVHGLLTPPQKIVR